ncbi:MAG: hypothetical protein AAB618_00575 [Patescibacteria group bacterium]
MNQRILGAFVIGFSLVAGAYTWVNFGEPRSSYSLSSQEAAPIRTAIAVTDNDNNGIEDWRDVFTTTEPVIIGGPAASYTPPTTVTGRLGIGLFEDFVRAKNYGPFGRSQEQVVTDTVNELARETEQVLYGLSDVSILDNANDTDIKNYANIMGGSIIQNSQTGLASELEILSDIIANQKTERLPELALIAGFYKSMRDEALAAPVPSQFTKEHLDLINVYEALYQDVTAMGYSLEDPAVTLLRIRRYQDDVLGLQLALGNMYSTLEPHSALFTANDPATIFSTFNPNNLTQ